MKRSLMSVAVMAFGMATAVHAAPVSQSAPSRVAASIVTDMQFGGADFVLIKDNKGKGKKAGGKKWRKEREKAGKAHRKAQEKGAKAAQKAEKSEAKAAQKAAKAEAKADRAADAPHFVARDTRTDETRRILTDRLLEAPAPDGRDMARLLSVVPLALLTRDVAIDTIPEDELLTYRNCPPGLAKKDPPCVPPGLAKDGVTYDEWTSYDDDRLEDLLISRREDYVDDDAEFDDLPEAASLLLDSQHIARLFALDPAPQGQRYGLIDGMPVLLDGADYATLVQVNELARVADLGNAPRVAPTAALSQDELRQLYRLPDAQENQNYAVLNGELVQLDDEGYETLQLIRIARAVF